MPNIDWNASDYQKHFSFVPSYGESVMELLTKPEGAFVVDLDCGNGMLTKKLAEKGYHVLGVDDSETMLRLAEKNCSGISFQTNELPLGQVEHDLRFDAVKILRDRNKCH